MAKDAKLLELEQRPIWPLLVSYSLPAITGMAAMSIYNIVGAIYVGQWCGAYAVTAMALVFPVINLMVAVGTLVGLGSAASASIALGQGKYRRAERILGHCLVLSFLTSVVVGWLPLPWIDDIMRAFGADENTLQPSVDYMIVLMLWFPFNSVFLGLNHLMRASGYPKKAMVSLLISMVVNVAVAPLFIYSFGWGIAGAGAATAAAQTVGLVWVLAHFCKRSSVLRFCRGIYALNWPLTRRICTIGMPPCLLNIVGCVVVLVFNTLFLKYDGQMGVGAYGVVNRVIFFFVMIVAGITQGMQPIAGYNLGLGKYCRVRTVLLQAMLFATAVTTFGTLCVQIFPREIVSLFVKEEDANASQIISIATYGITVISLIFPFVGSQMVISNFFQSIGRPVMSIFLTLTRQLIFLLPCLALLPGWFAEPGIWYAQVVSDALSVILGFTVITLFMKRYFKKDVCLPTEVV
ncbi:MAG: MATE family efflux transporter [Akkermansia sp.]|nr:MATE family efflux transporter [Akkermansia sp.]